MTDQRVVLTKGFTEASLDELLSAYDDWRSNRDEETFIDWEYQVDGGTHHLLILYTE